MRWEDVANQIRRSPFYRDRIGEISTPELSRAPLTRRADLLRDQLEHLPHGTRRLPGSTPVRAGVAGSGEDLLVLVWSAAELAAERVAGTRLLRRLGVAPGMRVANTLPGALATPGSLLLGDVIEELGGLDVPLGTIESEASARQAWELVDRVQPDVLVLDGPALLAATPAAPRPWWRGIVWLERPSGPIAAAAGFTGWERIWLAVPEATSFIAGSCTASRLHVDDRVMAEVVEERTGEVLPPGREGILALTLLDGETPLLRYASALRARVDPRPCPCGAAGLVIEVA